MSEYVTNSNHRKKQRLVRCFHGKCGICGYNKCMQALQFHHLDPNEKQFTISKYSNYSFERTSQEVRKCILLCSNCHKEYHSGLIDESMIQNATKFDEDIYLEVIQQLQDIKTRKIVWCKKCGKEISPRATTGYCADCYKKYGQMSTYKKANLTREDLKQMIRVLPFTQIGNKFNVTDNAIRKWCDAYKLPRTRKEINSYSDEQWEKI